MTNPKQSSRCRRYVKPRMEQVQLVTNEAVLANCKMVEQFGPALSNCYDTAVVTYCVSPS